MTLDTVLGLIAAVCLLVYLTVALLQPERF